MLINCNLGKGRYLRFAEASLRKKIPRVAMYPERPTLPGLRKIMRNVACTERYVCGRACYFGSQMPRASTPLRGVARIVAPAGVGGAQFIRNNYRGGIGTCARIWDAGVGALYFEARMFRL